MRNPLERLVEQIDQPLSPATRQAFLEVDRGRFVPSSYRREGKEWVHEETGERAYQDIPLMTKIEQGRPVSSSSMPSVMAAMIEALALQPGQNVLEIGTGTGYNAALLSQIVGKSSHIITVESDKEVAQAATERLAGRENVHIALTDGFTGYPSRAPYHRIIATAAFRQFPQAWREQLAPGGVFVGNLLSTLTSLLIRLQKHEDGSLHGSPVPHGAFFMEMHSPLIEETKAVDWRPYESKPIEAEYGEHFALTTLLKHQAFLLSLHCLYPTLQLHRRYTGGPIAEASSFETWIIDPHEQTSIAVSTEKIQSRGEHVWEKVQQSIFQWEEQKQPALETYSIFVSPHGEMKIGLPFHE